VRPQPPLQLWAGRSLVVASSLHLALAASSNLATDTSLGSCRCRPRLLASRCADRPALAAALCRRRATAARKHLPRLTLSLPPLPLACNRLRSPSSSTSSSVRPLVLSRGALERTLSTAPPPPSPRSLLETDSRSPSRAQTPSTRTRRSSSASSSRTRRTPSTRSAMPPSPTRPSSTPRRSSSSASRPTRRARRSRSATRVSA